MRITRQKLQIKKLMHNKIMKKYKYGEYFFPEAINVGIEWKLFECNLTTSGEQILYRSMSMQANRRIDEYILNNRQRSFLRNQHRQPINCIIQTQSTVFLHFYFYCLFAIKQHRISGDLNPQKLEFDFKPSISF